MLSFKFYRNMKHKVKMVYIYVVKKNYLYATVWRSDVSYIWTGHLKFLIASQVLEEYFQN